MLYLSSQCNDPPRSIFCLPGALVPQPRPSPLIASFVWVQPRTGSSLPLSRSNKLGIHSGKVVVDCVLSVILRSLQSKLVFVHSVLKSRLWRKEDVLEYPYKLSSSSPMPGNPQKRDRRKPSMLWNQSAIIWYVGDASRHTQDSRHESQARVRVRLIWSSHAQLGKWRQAHGHHLRRSSLWWHLAGRWVRSSIAIARVLAAGSCRRRRQISESLLVQAVLAAR